MPLTSTRTPSIPGHASPRDGSRTRLVVAAVVAAAVCVGAPVAAAWDEINRPGTVGDDALAVRITTTTTAPPTTTTVWPTSGGDLLFPVRTDNIGDDHDGVGCTRANYFGGPSGVNGSGGHEGVDIGADLGQEVYAVESGVLIRQNDNDGPAGWGWTLLGDPDDDGVQDQYRYYHLDRFAEGLDVGDRVELGEVIGYVGDTGNATEDGWHLHFEVRPGPQPEGGWGADPVDPEPLLAIPEVCVGFDAET